ncbi:MAG: hypothetical protein DWQ08_11735 [Proteobacteria bacterium]|nr:MAG: hypothetical protein DWQ08_11735 [Pseudomonadota bacterium]
MKGWKEQLREIKGAIADSLAGRKRDDRSKESGPETRLPSRLNIPVAKAHSSKAGKGTPVETRTRLPAEKPLRPAFRPRVAGGLALAMPDWGDSGQSLQYPGRRDGNFPPMVARIGVDFGTAFTKVAVRAGVDLVPIDWSPVTGDDSSMGRYVLPGMVGRTSDGQYCWDPTVASSLAGNLKLPVIDMAGSEECPTDAMAYLALVIRYSRAFLYRHKDLASKLAGRTLRWELNIGCPTEPHENPEVVRQFERIARVAWNLAADTELRASRIADEWKTAERSMGLEAEPGVVPEFVAQIAGYLESPQAGEGLHALIDIGAATLDVATFNVLKPNNLESLPVIPIFFSAVRPLGTHFLQYRRHSSLGLEPEWDDSVPVDSSDDFAKRHGKSPDAVQQADSGFAKEAVNCIVRIIDATRTNRRGTCELRDRWGRYHKGSVWRDGLPLFVTGGGASSDFYGRVIESAESDLRKRIGGLGKFRFIELDPFGGTFSNLGEEEARRLTVAIGLTEDSENIARITPHRYIEPIKRAVKERKDHGDLYSD